MSDLRDAKKKYESLKIIIAEYTAQISDLERRQVVTDTVKGSSLDYPYTQHPVKIEGKGTDEESRMLAQRADEIKKERAAAEKELKEITNFIDEIDDRLIKQAVKLRITQGLSWQQIVNRFGNVITEAALIMRVNRAIEKN